MKHKVFNLHFILLLFFTTPLYSIVPDSEVLKYISRCELRGYMLTQIDTIIIQVNNRNGEKYSDISIPYSKISKITEIDGWIVDATGKKVRTLKKSEIEDQSASSNSELFWDVYVKSFQLTHTSYPYKVYYTYKINKTELIAIANWDPIINTQISTKEARLYIKYPKGYTIKKYVKDVHLVKVDTVKNTVELEFASRYNKMLTHQVYSLPFDDIKPRVIVVPSQFFYGVEGCTDSWVTYGDWFLNLNKDILDLPDTEKKVVNEIVSNVSDTKEKIKILYHYMQDHTRYINVSIGVGGFKSYSASYVSENKYGDCKALTTYMMALLNYVGIKGYYALINASIQPENIIDEIPYPQFNHVVLCVPLQKDTIWIENTASSIPFGYLSSSIQNRKALFVDKGCSHIINTPKLSRNDAIVRKINFLCKTSENVEINALFNFKGYEFEKFNSLNTYYNKRDQDEILRSYLPLVNYEVLDWQFRKLDRDSSKIYLESKLKISNYLKPLGTDYYFNTLSILNTTFENPNERVLPLQIPFPLNSIDSISYTLSDNLVLKRLPEPISIKTEFGEYNLSTKINGNKFQVYKRLMIYPEIYSLERYKDFYSFIKQVKEAEKKVIVLSNKLL